MSDFNKIIHSKFDIHPKYESLVYRVKPITDSEHMGQTNIILATVAKFKQAETWFIYILNMDTGGADIVNLGDGDTKYERVGKSDITPEELLYKMIQKEK